MVLAGIVTLTLLAVALLVVIGSRGDDGTDTAGPATTVPDATTTSELPTTSTTTAPTTTASTEPPTTTTTEPPLVGWADPRGVGEPWSRLGAVEGLLTFRGNPSRSWHGRGPVPTDPEVIWTFEIGCTNSPVGGEPKAWCGSGWTGQPAVFHPPGDDETWWLGFGGYNRKVNFLDPATGAEVFPPYDTGDIIKGSITIDPDGYPLVYTGSRNGDYHVVAIDGDQPEVLWKLPWNAVTPTRWNNDWDGAGLIIDDYLLEGSESSRFFIVKLNRGYAADGRVTVDPEIVFSTPAWDDELLRTVSSSAMSIENSVVVSGDVVYFANSVGLIQGWDLSGVARGGEPTQVFRYWAGDDIDASLVADADGFLYAGVEYEFGNQRSQELGQVLKLDPSKPDDPLVWGAEARAGLGSGVWATPAIWQDLVIVPTDDGRVLGLDRNDGTTRWTLELPGPLWASPVVVDDVLIQGDCDGWLHAFGLMADAEPALRWSLELGGCIESTPAVWDGGIYVGSRDGTFYAIADR